MMLLNSNHNKMLVNICMSKDWYWSQIIIKLQTIKAISQWQPKESMFTEHKKHTNTKCGSYFKTETYSNKLISILTKI